MNPEVQILDEASSKKLHKEHQNYTIKNVMVMIMMKMESLL